MYKNHSNHSISSGLNRHRFREPNTPGGIEKITYIRNQQKHLLIVIMESHQWFNREVQVRIAGNHLILEAPFYPFQVRPVRTHLVQREVEEEFENGTMTAGISEVKLRSGFRYTLLSCQTVGPSLLKVVLQYRPEQKNNNENFNQSRRTIQ